MNESRRAAPGEIGGRRGLPGAGCGLEDAWDADFFGGAGGGSVSSSESDGVFRTPARALSCCCAVRCVGQISANATAPGEIRPGALTSACGRCSGCGGSVWESNPPHPPVAGPYGFEDR